MSFKNLFIFFDKKDLFFTSLSSIIQALANFVVIIILARFLTNELFTDFASIRSLILLFIPIVTVCSGLYLARSKPSEAKNDIFLSIILLSLITPLIFIIADLLKLPWEQKLSFLDLNNNGKFDISLIFLILSYGLYRIYEGYFRGVDNPKYASIIRGFVSPISIFSLILFIYFFPESLYKSIFYWSFFSMLTGLIILLIIWRSSLNLRDIKFYTSTKNYKKIFFWGLYRIPAGFLKMAITTFAIIVSSNSNNNFDSIYLISVIYIFKFIEAGLGSFTPSFVRIGVRLKEKDPSNIKKNLISLYSYGFMISLSISLIFYLSHDFILPLLFGNDFISSSNLYTKIFISGSLVFYILLFLMRPIIEGIYNIPITSISLFFSWFFTFIIIFIFDFEIIWVSIAILFLVPVLSNLILTSYILLFQNIKLHK